jgi:trk system potassium uptake protein TrkA
MKVIVLGAGHVGRAVVEVLHDEHEITVIDTSAERLAPLSDRYDVRVIEGNGASKAVLRQAGVVDTDLLIACSAREDANLVCALLAKRLSGAKALVRTSSVEYLEAWRSRELEIDFMVSPELETANAISGLIGIPAARQTDVFAEGKVQIVEFDVPADAGDGAIIGRALQDADLPSESKVVSIIRGKEMIIPRGEEQIRPGDRVVVIASPECARRWSELIAHARETVDDIVIFGAGQMGSAIARVLLNRGVRVRLVDANAERARQAAEALPDVQVFHAHAFDPEFLVRERVGRAAAVFAMNDDAKNLYAAVLAKEHGVRLTIALAHDPASVGVYESGGVDVAINPRQVVAEELVRFAHDPRIHQIAMLEDDRFEVLDLTVRPESELADVKFKDLPMTGSLIGAVVRNGTVIFPHGSDVLRAGDRVIIFVESRRASHVEQVL